MSDTMINKMMWVEQDLIYYQKMMSDAFKKILENKSKSTAEKEYFITKLKKHHKTVDRYYDRLNKMRVELEILTNDTKELLDEMTTSCQSEVQVEKKEIDIRKFYGSN